MFFYYSCNQNLQGKRLLIIQAPHVYTMCFHGYNYAREVVRKGEWSLEVWIVGSKVYGVLGFSSVTVPRAYFLLGFRV